MERPPKQKICWNREHFEIKQKGKTSIHSAVVQFFPFFARFDQMYVPILQLAESSLVLVLSSFESCCIGALLHNCIFTTSNALVYILVFGDVN